MEASRRGACSPRARTRPPDRGARVRSCALVSTAPGDRAGTRTATGRRRTGGSAEGGPRRQGPRVDSGPRRALVAPRAIAEGVPGPARRIGPAARGDSPGSRAYGSRPSIPRRGTEPALDSAAVRRRGTLETPRTGGGGPARTGGRGTPATTHDLRGGTRGEGGPRRDGGNQSIP